MNGVKTAIEECNFPVIVGHINPDADCIGSLVVMTSALRALGKQANLVLPVSTVSRKFSFLLDIIPEVVCSEGINLDADACDLIIVLDTALKNRIFRFVI